MAGRHQRLYGGGAGAGGAAAGRAQVNWLRFTMAAELWPHLANRTARPGCRA